MSKRMENMKARKKIEPHKFLRQVYFEVSDIFEDVIAYCVAEELNFKEEMDRGITQFAYYLSSATRDEEIKKLVLKQANFVERGKVGKATRYDRSKYKQLLDKE